MIDEEVMAEIALNTLYAGAYQGHSLLLNRVFEENKTAAGQDFGGYSENYKKYRASLGRQVNKKDLQLTGDLLNSIKQSENIIYFNNEIDAEKALSQEKQMNADIFVLNEQEKAECFEVMNTIFVELLKNATDDTIII